MESGAVFETTCSLRHDSDKNDVTGNLTVTYDVVTPSLPPRLHESVPPDYSLSREDVQQKH